MITFPIIDAHLHVWDINKLKYPWLSEVPFLNRTFLMDDYKKACGPVDVEKMVFVQCECDPSQYKDEVAWVTGLAKNEDKRIQGIVSWAPLEKGEKVRPEIEELAKNSLVKGIRRIIQSEEDIEFCLKPNFIRGVNILAKYGLTFDICIYPKQNKSVIKLIERCPDVKFIVDHIGKPDIKNRVLDPWREEIRELSKFSNVYCKVSSLATEADHKNWKIDDIMPFANHIFECFGFDRTVFAGDWPVALLAADIPLCVETVEKIVSGCSNEELKKLFYVNAEKFYNIRS